MAEGGGGAAGLGEEAGGSHAERAEGPYGEGPASSGGHGGGSGGPRAAGAASEHFCPNYRAIRNALRSSPDGTAEVGIPADDLMKILMFCSLHPDITSAVKDGVGELTAALDGPESPEGTVSAPRKAVRRVMKCVAEKLQADLGRVAPARRAAAEPQASAAGGAAAAPAAAAAAAAAAPASSSGTAPSSTGKPSSLPEQPPAAAEPPQPAEASNTADRLAALRQKLLDARMRKTSDTVVKVEDEAEVPVRPPSRSRRRRRRSERASSSRHRSRSHRRAWRRKTEHRTTRSSRRETRSAGLRRESRSRQRPRASPSAGRPGAKQAKQEPPAEPPPGHWHSGRQGPAAFPPGRPQIPRLHPGVGPCDRLRGHVATLCPDGSGYIASDSVQGDLWFQAHPALRLRVGDTVDFDFARAPQGLPLAAHLEVLPHLAPASQQQGAQAFHRPYSSSHGQLRLATEFMRRHACRTHEESYTHSSMLGKNDPWASGVGRFGFGAEPHAQEELARALEVFYLTEGGGKLYLTEHPTELYAFVEDIDVEGTRSSGPPDLMRPSDGDLELLKWRATVLRDMFPSAQFRCMLYQSTGWYSGSELYKESYHLVWRDILVDKDTAVQIRQRTVEVFENLSETPGHPVSYLLARAKQFNDYNTWERIFDASTTRRSVGLRMPYCDKRSILPGTVRKSWRDEYRPVLPVGELEFRIESSEEAKGGEVCTSVLLAERPEQRPPWQWALLGMCRRPEGARRTHFRPPRLDRPPPPPKAAPQRSGARRPGSGTSAPLGTKGKGKSKGKSKGKAGKSKGKGKSPAAGKGKGAAALPARSSSAGREQPSKAVPLPEPTPALPPFSQTRLFRNGTRAAFREALLQRSRTPLEEKTISGGVQFVLPGQGNVNYFEKSLKVVIQGRDGMALKALVEGWTEPA